MAFTLPKLPYPEDALAPHISSKTMQFHHGKHHAAYVKKLNELIEGTPYDGKTLDHIIRESHGKERDNAIFNNAAQNWNHTFFWHSMSPGGGGAPKEAAAEMLQELGGAAAFRESFLKHATGQFGSGWAWLVRTKSGEFKVTSTANQDNPMTNGEFPVMGNDVWEHAYYLKYQNRRPDYLKAWWNVVNWDEVNKRLAQADSFFK